MRLNRCKLISALINITDPSITKKRTWDTQYNNKSVTYWNDLLWKKILEHETIFGYAINRYEFCNYCGNYCSNREARKIFNYINTNSRCISFTEFEDFLERLSDYDYSKIIESLEIEDFSEFEKIIGITSTSIKNKIELNSIVEEEQITREQVEQEQVTREQATREQVEEKQAEQEQAEQEQVVEQVVEEVNIPIIRPVNEFNNTIEKMLPKKIKKENRKEKEYNFFEKILNKIKSFF
tara:strand:+ start:101 stop:814 length:714 start_codon:yes stop_codon:yes gene_type:complete